MKKQKARPTIQDVARLAGVSTATVSRALQTPKVVSEKARLQVKKAVQATGYRGNSAAQMLRRNRARTVLVIVPNIGNTFFSEILAGIENVASKAGYTILMAESGGDPDRKEKLMDFLLNGRADGALLLDGHCTESFFSVDTVNRLPVVSVSESIAGVSISHVGIDNQAAAALAVRHLVSMGHQRIAHLAGPAGNILTEARIAGYKAEMNAAGLAQHSQIISGDFSTQSGVDFAELFIKNDIKPTAIFCANDEMAMGVISGLLNQKILVPRDISVMGFDDIQFAKTFIPPISTVRQPRFEMGSKAMELLLATISGEQCKASATHLEYNLIIRDSVKNLNN